MPSTPKCVQLQCFVVPPSEHSRNRTYESFFSLPLLPPSPAPSLFPNPPPSSSLLPPTFFSCSSSSLLLDDPGFGYTIAQCPRFRSSCCVSFLHMSSPCSMMMPQLAQDQEEPFLVRRGAAGSNVGSGFSLQGRVQGLQHAVLNAHVSCVVRGPILVQIPTRESSWTEIPGGRRGKLAVKRAKCCESASGLAAQL